MALDPELFITAKSVGRTLLLPPTGPLLVALMGLLMLRWKPRAGRILALGGVVILLVLATPVVSRTLLRAIDDSPPFERESARDAQAIVILGGGVRRDAREYGGDTLGRLTLERVRYGARVARQTGLPVLVTGGSLGGAATEASLMRACLQDEFNVPVRWLEDRSRTTRENARNSAQMLLRDGVRSVVLVAHSVDMRRARAEFASAGLTTIAAPTGLVSTNPPSFRDWLPGLDGLAGSYYAFYEGIGEVVRRITAQ